MKRLFLSLAFVAVAYLQMGGCASTASNVYKAVTTGYSLSASGQTGVVNDDQLVVRTEQVLNIALDTFDTFLKIEYDNRQGLEKVSPKIHEWAENVRRNGKDWIKSAQRAKKVYSQNRTAENHANLVTAYKTLKAGIEESQKYISRHSGV